MPLRSGGRSSLLLLIGSDAVRGEGGKRAASGDGEECRVHQVERRSDSGHRHAGEAEEEDTIVGGVVHATSIGSIRAEVKPLTRKNSILGYGTPMGPSRLATYLKISQPIFQFPNLNKVPYEK